MLVIHLPFIALVKDSAKYTPDMNSLLYINQCPMDLVGNFIIFSDLAFRLSLQFSLLTLSGLGSNFTTISHYNLLVAVIYKLCLSSKKLRPKIP